MPSSDAPVAAPATLEALELSSLLRFVAALTATADGAAAAPALAPATSRDELERRRARFVEVERLVSEAPLVPAIEEPLGGCLDDLAEGGRGVDGPGLLVVGSLLRTVRDAMARIRAAEPPCDALAARVARQPDPAPLLARLESVLDRRGKVREDATPELARLAAEVRRRRDRIYRELESFVDRHRSEMGEETVPLHGGRLVLLVKAEAQGRLKGLVHGRSGSGQSVYFEPFEAVAANNGFQEARQGVDEEMQRLLAELVAAARRELPALEQHLELVAELDVLQAAARFATAAGARLVQVSPRHDLVLTAARHPLLDPRLAELRERALGHPGHTGPVVPLDLELGAERRALVVTGPNAGGKTVALKTVGLLALASQAGLPVPAGAGTRLPFFSRIVATVGDEQSLLRDRSTFSGRLLRLREAWEGAAPDALVLLDELGSGTDPEEGAALSVALLEGLLERRCLALLTTHLTPLAAAALERPGAFCAAMEFEAGSGSPTFQLLPGPPGGSEALALARRLGLPPAWIERAEELLGPEHRELRRLLSEVEELRREVARDRDRARSERRDLEAARRRIEGLEQELADERRELAGRLKKQLDEFRRQVKRRLRAAEDQVAEELRAGRRKRVVERAVEELFEPAPEVSAAEPEPAGPIVVGAPVEHASLGWRGVVERLERGRALVTVGGKRLRAPAADLRRVAEEAAPAGKPRRRKPVLAAPIDVPGDELMLVGKHVEPALEELDAYLDRALLAEHAEVRVVHGHGSGRLRRAVRDHLKAHPAVASTRPGGDHEGGDGATVARLRD